jgi:hypothetical protein
MGGLFCEFLHYSLPILMVKGLSSGSPERVVWEDARHRRQVGGVSVDHSEERDNNGLVGGDRVEIAHSMPITGLRGLL